MNEEGNGTAKVIGGLVAGAAIAGIYFMFFHNWEGKKALDGHGNKKKK